MGRLGEINYDCGTPRNIIPTSFEPDTGVTSPLQRDSDLAKEEGAPGFRSEAAALDLAASVAPVERLEKRQVGDSASFVVTCTSGFLFVYLACVSA